MLLPGQPLPARFNAAPTPQAGAGCHWREGKLISSIIGIPVRDGSVGKLSLYRKLYNSQMRKTDDMVSF
jgi:hypothetical protein